MSIQSVKNSNVPTWENNNLFKIEHRSVSMIAKDKKIYDHILYIPKTPGSITIKEDIKRLEWPNNKPLSDHYLIYSKCNIEGEDFTIGSFNIQDLLGLRLKDKNIYDRNENFYDRKELLNFFIEVSNKNIDIIGMQELMKSFNDIEGVSIISAILTSFNAEQKNDCEYTLYYENINGENPTSTAIIYNSKKLTLNNTDTVSREGERGKGATRAKFTSISNPSISFYFISVHLVSKKSCELSRKYIINNTYKSIGNNEDKVCNQIVRKDELQKYISCINSYNNIFIVGDFNTGHIEFIRDVESICNTTQHLGGKMIRKKKKKTKKRSKKIKRSKKSRKSRRKLRK